MGQKLPSDQLKLYKRIDEILFYKWDPIGVSDWDWSRDEYHSYLPHVYQLALENDSPQAIAEYLTKITTERIGVKANVEHDLKIATLIIEIKDRYID